MQESNELYTLARYRAAVRRIQKIGLAVFAAGALLRFALGAQLEWPGLLVGGIGVCIIMAGVACLRPHNVIKTFASLCLREPSKDNALCLLSALEAKKKVRMTATSISSIEQAIVAYASTDDVDKELAEKLAAALNSHVVRKMFF